MRPGEFLQTDAHPVTRTEPEGIVLLSVDVGQVFTNDREVVVDYWRADISLEAGGKSIIGSAI
jgi:hypothetical protein